MDASNIIIDLFIRLLGSLNLCQYMIIANYNHADQRPNVAP